MSKFLRFISVLLLLTLLITSCNNSSSPAINNESVSDDSTESTDSTTEVSDVSNNEASVESEVSNESLSEISDVSEISDDSSTADVSDTTSETSTVEVPIIEYTVTQKEYSESTWNITYPYLQSDTKDYSAINEFLESKIFDYYKGRSTNNTMDVRYEIMSSSENILSIAVYICDSPLGATHPFGFINPVNIDLTTGKEVKIDEIVKIDENFVTAYQNSLDSIENSELREYLSQLNNPSSFKNINFYIGKTCLGVYIPVQHSWGDYKIVEISYDDIPNWEPIDVVEATNYTIIEKKYSVNNNISIKYPQISTETNSYFRSAWIYIYAARLVYTSLDPDLEGLTANVDYEITHTSDNIISIVFEGTTKVTNTSDTYYNIDAYNINIGTDRDLRLTAFYTVNQNFATKIKEAAAASSNENIKTVFNSIFAPDLLSGIDSYDSNSCWYLTEDSLVLCIQVNHSKGDFVKLEIPFEDIEEFALT